MDTLYSETAKNLQKAIKAYYDEILGIDSSQYISTTTFYTDKYSQNIYRAGGRVYGHLTFDIYYYPLHSTKVVLSDEEFYYNGD